MYMTSSHRVCFSWLLQNATTIANVLFLLVQNMHSLIVAGDFWRFLWRRQQKNYFYLADGFVEFWGDLYCDTSRGHGLRLIGDPGSSLVSCETSLVLAGLVYRVQNFALGEAALVKLIKKALNLVCVLQLQYSKLDAERARYCKSKFNRTSIQSW